MAFDLSDYTEAWLCNETGDTAANLLGVNGNNWTNATGSLGAPTGFVSDPIGTVVARGAFNPAGTPATDIYVSQAFSASDIFDIRGQTSCTFAGWHILDPSCNMNPFSFAIHNPSAASGQALLIQIREPTIGTDDAPSCTMLDGIASFNGLTAKIEVGVDLQNNVWQFIAGGYDATRNKVFVFWGRGVNEWYYDETDGFSAGFGYTGAAGCTNSLHRFSSTGPSSTNNQVDATDQLLWWNGRALTQNELYFLWNNHEGRRIDQLIQNDEAAIHFFKNKKLRILENNAAQRRFRNSSS